MNLSEALDAALPELPKTWLARSRPPRLDPEIVAREDLLDGEPIVAVLKRETGSFYRLLPAQWELAKLFDGIRTYDQIAELYTAQSGSQASTEDVRFFAETLDQSDFWHKTPQEKNLALSQKLMSQRGRRSRRSSKFDLVHMTFSGWDPDRYFSWVDRKAGSYLYSSWCVLTVVLLFLFEVTVFISKWSVIGPDVPLYYNFTHKTAVDLAQFWVLFLVLGFFHESAHGLTCKHYGGQVHSMGLMFLFLLPAFYVDVTEAWISATKVQRLATIIAGIWIEMTFCGLAMIVWINTMPGQWLHDFAYQVILITGIAVIVMNMNPLIKLDGYYFFTELIGIPDLKERSTDFVSGWFQSKILGLPVETPVVARRSAPLFVLYALASGIYSYTLLFFVVRLSYNIGSKWLAEFALIPAATLAFLMFRSRLVALRNVILRFWEKYFGSGRGVRPAHVAGAVLLILFLFVPIWRDRESAYFVIEPMRSETVHAAVSGRVDAVLVHRGEAVRAGQPLVRMSSDQAAAMGSVAEAQAKSARFQAVNAELRGESIGAGAAAQQNASARATGLAREAQSSLVIAAPADGTVLTPDPGALLGQNVGSGEALLALADEGPRTVRVFIPVSGLDRIPADAEVALALPGSFSIVRMKLGPTGSDALALPPGLVASQDYKGIKLPVFYSSRMTLPASAGYPLLGSSGQAKIFGARRSLVERMLTVVLNLIKAHVW